VRVVKAFDDGYHFYTQELRLDVTIIKDKSAVMGYIAHLILEIATPFNRLRFIANVIYRNSINALQAE